MRHREGRGKFSAGIAKGSGKTRPSEDRLRMLVALDPRMLEQLVRMQYESAGAMWREAMRAPDTRRKVVQLQQRKQA
jgi:hypothetical protein